MGLAMDTVFMEDEERPSSPPSFDSLFLFFYTLARQTTELRIFFHEFGDIRAK